MHVSIFCRYLTKKLQAQHVHGLVRSNYVLKWNVVVKIIEIYRLLGEVVGYAGLIRNSDEICPQASKIERLYRTASIITFGGGANEIQRDIISAAGLWMPRASR